MLISYLRQRDWKKIALLTVGLYVISQMWAQMAMELRPTLVHVMLRSGKALGALCIITLCIIVSVQCVREARSG